MINLKRAYGKPDKQDGFRILVERLWPRGLKKDAAALDLWLKDIAPSPELRRWFAHDPPDGRNSAGAIGSNWRTGQPRSSSSGSNCDRGT